MLPVRGTLHCYFFRKPAVKFVIIHRANIFYVIDELGIGWLLHFVVQYILIDHIVLLVYWTDDYHKLGTE